MFPERSNCVGENKIKTGERVKEKKTQISNHEL